MLISWKLIHDDVWNFADFLELIRTSSRRSRFLMPLIVFLSGWLIGLFDGLVPGWWWVLGTGGGNMQREQTSPCSLCPNSGSSGIKQQKWDTASQGGQVGSRIDHWWRWSQHAARNHPQKIRGGGESRRQGPRTSTTTSLFALHKCIRASHLGDM